MVNDIEALTIESACRRLVGQYAHAIDLGHAGDVAELFTADGVWESPERRLDGGSAIAAAFGDRAGMERTSRHVCTTSVFTIDSADEASGITYFTLYRHDGPLDGPAPLGAPAMVGHYEDRFVRTPDGWRFAHRRAVASFVAGATAGGGGQHRG